MLRGIATYLRRHHVAFLALFLALGGTSVAASQVLLPRNSVGTAQLKNGAVTKQKINKKTISALRGARGAQGAPGPAGPQGPQGPQGPEGPAGAPNPNADALNGYHANELVRGTAAANSPFFSALTMTSQKTVSITLPKDGFVLVNASYSAIFTAGCPCDAFLRIRDVRAGGTSSPDAFAQFAAGSWGPVMQTWVFKEAAGTYTFSADAGVSGTVTVANPTLTALYVPFGSTGGSTLAPTSAAARQRAIPVG
jgi:hypothetical protein